MKFTYRYTALSVANQLGPKGDMRSCGVLSVVSKTLKCTSHLGIGLEGFLRLPWTSLKGGGKKPSSILSEI